MTTTTYTTPADTEIEIYPSKEARDAALGTRMRDGASLSFDRLDDYLRARQ
jgi:uncharacterized protein YndB with AHSA1/START domain